MRRLGFDERWPEPPVPCDDVTPLLVGPITVRPVDISDPSQFPEIAAAIAHARKLRGLSVISDGEQ